MRTHSMALVAAALATACSTISTTYDYDTQFDFSTLKYYTWIDGTGIDEETGTNEQTGINELNARRIRSAVNRVLSAKGYVEATENLDFLVAMHGGSRSRVSVSQRSPGYGGWYGPGGVEVYQYEEGMLTIDIVDARKNQLIWRGTATKVLSRNPTPEKVEETINRAVEKLFEKFPPPQASEERPADRGPEETPERGQS